MNLTVLDRLAERARARALGDVSLERACNADLIRNGYVETVEAEAMPERAVPAKPRRGRPPRPRCEHDQIVGRCAECADDDPAA